MNQPPSKFWLSLPICCQQMLTYANKTGMRYACTGHDYRYHSDVREFYPETPQGTHLMNQKPSDCTCDPFRGLHYEGCPFLCGLTGDRLPPQKPSSSSDPKDYTVPICSFLWRVTVADQYGQRTAGTYILATSAAMALAVAGRFYDWPSLSNVAPAKSEPGVISRAEVPALEAEISVQCYPQKMFVKIAVYPVRALTDVRENRGLPLAGWH